MAVIFQTTLLYWATALDLLLILALLYAKYPHAQHRLISLGQTMGSVGLVLVSFLLAVVFHFVPESWILGFLGLIPMAFGLKYLILGDNDEAEVAELIEKRKHKSLFFTAVLISFASCGADNIGLFTPYLVNLKIADLLLALGTFLANIFLLSLISHRLTHLFPRFSEQLEKYNRWILSTVYIGLGLMILIESGTISHVIGLLKGV
ncbi:MAG: CadD family cadmium resistance transporter [Streptococcaceae bacterium]|jgi:cadmium resistance transport/sequestration family protein|nr:CadD family cadmium resistance transporter [Streptococcaceae bacterium]